MCKDEEQMVFSLPSCMWFVYGALLKQGSTLNPRTGKWFTLKKVQENNQQSITFSKHSLFECNLNF